MAGLRVAATAQRGRVRVACLQVLGSQGSSLHRSYRCSEFACGFGDPISLGIPIFLPRFGKGEIKLTCDCFCVGGLELRTKKMGLLDCDLLYK